MRIVIFAAIPVKILGENTHAAQSAEEGSQNLALYAMPAAGVP